MISTQLPIVENKAIAGSELSACRAAVRQLPDAGGLNVGRFHPK